MLLGRLGIEKKREEGQVEQGCAKERKAERPSGYGGEAGQEGAGCGSD